MLSWTHSYYYGRARALDSCDSSCGGQCLLGLACCWWLWGVTTSLLH